MDLARHPSPLTFGRAMLEHWLLDPAITYLNHGTVGATPRRVLEAQQAIRDEIERQPARYLLRELMNLAPGPPARPPRMRVAAEAVAAFMGARGEDLVFVDNATTGVNAVLRSLRLEPGDELLITDLAYGAVINTAAFVARERGARLVTVHLPFPTRDPGEYVERVARAVTPRTRVAILDHVTSESALILPLAEMAAACRARGVPVLADGAHAPGAIPLDIPGLGVDWYTGNLHKWAFAPRSCGFLWVAPERQRDLHPPVISWGLDQGLHQEFDWVGTRDPSPFLAAPEGIAFMQDFLGLEAMRRYNHALAWQAAQHLTERWETRLETPRSMVGCMVSVPLPEHAGSTREEAARLKDALLFEHRIEAPVIAVQGRLWVRVSAQVYNDLDDIERLARAVENVLAQSS
ncbi:aminotransferase class V-fold PLP-dependent enzyme [Calidithermus chliarophilus]|uniref:aminotransferase class V-fold PLP-dependent enzyme n=1 Tax=Calidithermus chliarophilus TaxID=52023 RepID=UPI000417FC0F|nr:aminotransferase class V-fold PLP-dependent enzyme [Calidithermus chliarophilus]